MAIIAYRRMMLRLAKDLQKGIEPYAPHNGDLYRVRPIDVMSDEGDFNRVFEQHKDLATAKA